MYRNTVSLKLIAKRAEPSGTPEKTSVSLPGIEYASHRSNEMTCGKNGTDTATDDEKLFECHINDGYRIPSSFLEEDSQTKNIDVGDTVQRTLKISFSGFIFAHKAHPLENVLRSCFIMQRTPQRLTQKRIASDSHFRSPASRLDTTMIEGDS